MTNLITGMVLGNKKSNKSGYARFGAMALLLFAVLAPFAIQKFLTIDPTVVGLVGIPMIILLGFIGSVTVIIPVPVLPLVFTGAAILNPVGLVIAAAASITAGMAVCYILGRRGHSRAAQVTADSQARLPAPISSFYSWSTDNVGTASFLIAATPNPVFDYAGIIAGAGRVDVRRFLAGTFFGKMAQTSVIAYLGHTVGGHLFGII
jgi:uncharacterized membrane protein YdjX (TVP38/TMEM64 family)